jgi:hypothetical protein
MTDIHLAIAVVVTLSAAAGVSAYRVARRGRRPVVLASAAVCVAALVLNVAYWRHSLWPARVWPYPNLIVFADPNPLLVGLLAGLAAAAMPGAPWRRAVLLAPLAGLCVWGSYAPLFARPPELHNTWRRGVCRQTSPASCGPAAAATLLAAHGIRTSEQEMARLCLTSPHGTSARGIYRGLALKTADTPLRVEPFHGDIEALRNAGGPVLLTARLDLRPGVDPRYHQEWGWVPGVPHTVVVFRALDNDLFDVGDPAAGRELWNRRALETLWHGEGLRLVPR